MAWTTSAGPRGDFAQSAWAAARDPLRVLSALSGPASQRRILALCAVIGGHLATLSVVASRIAGDPTLVALTVLASLAVSAAVVVLVLVPTDARAEQADGNVPQRAATDATSKIKAAAPLVRAALNGEAGSALSRSTHSDLMARVSHELRTPLNAVVGFSDLMGHEMFGPLGHPRYEEYVGYIRESGRRLLKSTEDTLAITSLLTEVESSPKLEEVSLASLARDARQIVAAEAHQRDVRIVFEIDPDVAVLAHRRALRQILVNLLSEALVRADVSGEITLAADVADDRVLVRIASEAGSGVVEAQASLPICIARTLVELSGGRLLERFDEEGRWHVSTLLERAAQRDFFLPPRRDIRAVALVS